MTISYAANRLASKISKRDGDRVEIIKADGMGETGKRWEMSRYYETRQIWIAPTGYNTLREIAETQHIEVTP
jgi:ribosomal protein L13